ncbi:MAG: NapC/NirT family cytochrome c [Planctomycetota bacterium]
MPTFSGLQRLVLLLRSNWLSAAGAVLTTFAFLGFASTLLLSSVGTFGGPYLGLVTFLFFPSLFVVGLLLIPLGLILFRKRVRGRMDELRDRPLRLVRAVLILTLVNIVLVATAGFQGIHYMDSAEFCGLVCHSVMEPQYNAYLESPHARVRCVECHIGPGASWFVKSKLDGARQVLAVAFDTYERPIPTPVTSLRPARETCEQCHWPDRHSGDRVVVRRHFREDRENTPWTNVLLMKTGGRRPDGRVTGIHWHMSSDIEVRYRAIDDRRMEIPWVKVVHKSTGEEEIFLAEGADVEALAGVPERVMDCVDCHNQPSHRFDDLAVALDEAMAAGRISPKLPFVRKKAAEVLQGNWSRERAPGEIEKALTEYYTGEEPLGESRKALLGPAIEEITKIWLRNVYPDMRIGFDTYRRLLRHEGCRRCHEGNHESAAGRIIPVDCSICHVLLCTNEPNPPILRKLGMDRR